MKLAYMFAVAGAVPSIPVIILSFRSHHMQRTVGDIHETNEHAGGIVYDEDDHFLLA
jgi:hypothetical protein